MLSKIELWLSGKKTFIVAILTGVIGIYASMGHAIPEWVWALLGAAGLGAVRSAITSSSTNTTPTTSAK